MNPPLPRVVLDTVVFVQALISGRGPAARCVQKLQFGNFIHLMSDDTSAEPRDVPFRPNLRAKYPFITDKMVSAFVLKMESLSIRIARPPRIFELPRDPKDEPFIDLAAAGAADFIVTWNQTHMTYLMGRDTPEGVDFCSRFPGIKIVAPPEFLTVLDVP
jgi:putative PIN family toxin of toxin-antitoxin system